MNNVMRHEYHPIAPDDAASILAIKDAGLALYAQIDRLERTKFRELEVAKQHVEEAVMWATKHLTRWVPLPNLTPLPASVNAGDSLTQYISLGALRHIAKKYADRPEIVVHFRSELEPDIRDLPGFVPSHKYPENMIYKDEIGRCERFRFAPGNIDAGRNCYPLAILVDDQHVDLYYFSAKELD